MSTLADPVGVGLFQKIAMLQHRVSWIFPKTPVGRYLLWTAFFSGAGFVGFQKLLRRELSKSSQGQQVTTTTKHVIPQKHPVNSLFMKRLIRIIKIIIPSWRSTEFMHIVVLSVLLLTRSLLSLLVAEITGRNAYHLVQRKWEATVKGVLTFALLGIPASIVNSALRYETSILSVRFRKRLGDTINAQYLNDVNFYKASHLGLGVDDTDRRVTADVEQFCDSLSSLYTTIFKPVLDVILFTARLSRLVGFRGPIILILYYFLAATLKRFTMPSFGKLLARQVELEGDYRTAHQRLIVNAEEIAFYDGSQKERHIITRLFNEIYKHSFYVQYVKAILGVFDSFVAKYGSSIAGYVILALPIFFPQRLRPCSAADLTQGFVRNRQILINLSDAISQLINLSKKIRSLAGLTGRVAEFLEMVRRLDRIGSRPFEVKLQKKEQVANFFQVEKGQVEEWLKNWKLRGELVRELREQRNSPVVVSRTQREGGHVIFGKFIRFENVDIVSPDGRLLVHDLTFEVKRNENVMVMGPNGSGKSSLFRALGDLWPMQCGTVVKPHKEDILFVPQKPYLVLGTLRDQIIYPHSRDDMHRLGISDEDLRYLISIVDEGNTILQQWSWSDVRDWETLSVGQKQRIAMARLFYHRPLFAILDECTSAVSDEAECVIYQTCKELGITLFTVSHRHQLTKYHDFVLKFTGHEGGWEWQEMEHDG